MSKESCGECALYKYASEIINYSMDTLATFSIEELKTKSELEEKNHYFLGVYQSLLSRLDDIEQYFKEDPEGYAKALEMKNEVKKTLEEKLKRVFQSEDRMTEYISKTKNQAQERLDVATDFITQANNHCIGPQLITLGILNKTNMIICPQASTDEAQRLTDLDI